MTLITLAVLFSFLLILIFFFPELSLFLEKRKLNGAANRVMIEEVVRAVKVLARKKIPSFFILKRKNDLFGLLRNGEEINKIASAPIIVEYFFLGCQKGRGKVVLENGFLRAVNVKTMAEQNLLSGKELNKERFEAVFLTKKSDAIVIFTNEKGSISLAYGGNITPRVSNLKLENVLLRFFKTKGRILRERKIVVNRI